MKFYTSAWSEYCPERTLTGLTLPDHGQITRHWISPIQFYLNNKSKKNWPETSKTGTIVPHWSVRVDCFLPRYALFCEGRIITTSKARISKRLVKFQSLKFLELLRSGQYLPLVRVKQRCYLVLTHANAYKSILLFLVLFSVQFNYLFRLFNLSINDNMSAYNMKLSPFVTSFRWQNWASGCAP